MKKTRPINGEVIIKTKELWDDITESGIYKDVTYDVHGKMIIFAEVVSVSERGSDEVMSEISNSFPRTKEEAPIYIRNYDIKHDIREGDRVYFHYLTLEDPHNNLGIEDGYHIFRVKVHDIFLSMRPDPDGKYVYKGRLQTPKLHNQYVLGKPYWGVGWDELSVDGVKVACRVNSSGLVTETKDKPLTNYAVITDIGNGYKPFSRRKEVNTGDVVVLNPGCEFVNEIDGKERWVFTHEDIFGIIKKDGVIQPVCDSVLIELKDREYNGSLIVDVKKLPLINEGIVLSKGKEVSDLIYEGAEVKFMAKRTRVIDEKYAIVPEGHIYGILSYSI